MADEVLFLGWDVGSWKCTGNSRDALQLLAWRQGRLRVAGESFHANLLPDPNAPISLEWLLSQVRHGKLPPQAKIVLAVDAVFGWPRQFRHLLEGQADYTPPAARSGRSTQNRYLYRETERFLDARFPLGSHPPMTAVGGSIGSAATKAQFVLARLRDLEEFYVPPLDAWNADRARHAQITIIEVYPGVAKRSLAFKSLNLPTGGRVSALGKTDPDDALRAALVAVCYARTVGIIEGDFPFVYTPSDVKEDDDLISSAFGREGWIFTPKNE